MGDYDRAYDYALDRGLDDPDEYAYRVYRDEIDPPYERHEREMRQRRRDEEYEMERQWAERRREEEAAYYGQQQTAHHE